MIEQVMRNAASISPDRPTMNLPPMAYRFLWQRRFARIPRHEWPIFSVSTPEGRLSPFDKLWWTSTIDGRYFRRSTRGRFALGPLAKICYLASDASIAISETSQALRGDRQLTLDKVIQFHSPVPRKLSPGFRIRRGVPLLDLTGPDVPFLKSLERYRLIDNRANFYDQVIFGRHSVNYPITQAIARCAFRNRYCGIIWQSVRQTTDWISTSPDCIVLFCDNALTYT